MLLYYYYYFLLLLSIIIYYWHVILYYIYIYIYTIIYIYYIVYSTYIFHPSKLRPDAGMVSNSLDVGATDVATDVASAASPKPEGSALLGAVALS